jgi:hypothetical protein
MATANEKTSGSSNSQTSREVDKLLRLAEGLQEKCEQYERRLWIVLFGAIGLISGCLAFGSYMSSLSDRNYGWWGFALGNTAGVLSGLYFFQYRTRRLIRREGRALHSIVNMLRELESGFAEKNEWSVLERAEFCIRLSRFDIAPGLGNKGSHADADLTERFDKSKMKPTRS